ncbi:MAG: PspC domain-containing protein [bacterium]|nr:PspC domain-containing protein [bacterium]
METQPKKLYRSRTHKVFAGICGGMADYFSMDVTIIRLLWVLGILFTGIFPGVIIYIIAIFVIPEQPPSTS